MKNTCITFIMLWSILILGYSHVLDQNYMFDSNNPGTWEPNYTSARPELGNGISQDILCGFGFRQMKFNVSLCNCNCKNVVFQQVPQWKCNYCNNQFWRMSNAFKGIFCSYSDWNLKIQKITEAGNTNSGNWRQFRCPKGQYASRVAVRNTGSEQGVDLGLNGMLMECQNIKLGSGQIVKDNYDYQLSQLSNNQQGNFVSSYRLKMSTNGTLLGIDFGFEQTKNLKKQYKRQLTYTYSLSNTDIWANYPELNMKINVEQSKRYFIKYNIQTYRISHTPGYLCVRLLINDKQLTQFRSISGNIVFNFNQISGFVNLSTGVNKIQVQYRNSGQIKDLPFMDYNCAVLQVQEF